MPERYRTIVADPPWPQGKTGVLMWKRDKPEDAPMPYRTMSLEDIATLPVASLAEKDAHLYLWTTQMFLRDTFDVAEAWGFKVSCTLAWCKQPRGWNMGGTFGSTMEFCLFCRRGSLPAKQRVDRQWFDWPRPLGAAVPRGEKRPYQGTKPDAFIDLVEATSPGPYVELFARRARFGWDYWGDQSLGTAEMEAA